MDEQQLQQQIVQLVQAAIQGDQQATQQIQQIMLAAQLLQQYQVQAAKFGAKLNYIKQLRGVCPEGYEMHYFKAGGQLCKQCVAKQKKMEEGGKAPSNPVDAFKCGRKMKKRENGGNIDFSKCGSKMKKKACGGSVEKDKCGTKIKAACGSKLPMDKCGGKAKKKKISKHLFGGKPNRPFTGFEGLSYLYEAPTSNNDYTEYETITNNGKFLIDRSKYMSIPTTSSRMTGEVDPNESYTVYSLPEKAYIDATPSQIKAFNSLKRHAIMNLQLGNLKFACGGKAKKKQ